MPPLELLYDYLIRYTRAQGDRRRREWHIACPSCGHLSSPRAPHCSFSLKGWHCFVCGAGGSLSDLAGRLGIDPAWLRDPSPGRSAPAPPLPTQPSDSAGPRRAPSWMRDPEPYLVQAESHPERLALWAGYKPLRAETIAAQRLGVSPLPRYSSACPHPRLIVPIFAQGRLVGLRGRALSCECGKWRAAAGTALSSLPLYNDGALQSGQVVFVVENPVDALLLTERTPYVGVATYSVSYWQSAWLEKLLAARPELVVVAYDNDLPGNGGGRRHAELRREWLETHRAAPPPAGPRLANLLRAAGLEAVLFPWGDDPAKADVGQIL